MHTAIRLATTTSVLAALLQAFPATPIAVEPSLTPRETSHIYTFRTESDAALTQWALTRFYQAGLELPPLIVAFHDGKQPCDGYVGLFRSADTPRVDICGFNWDRFLITPKKTLLHELAHAWAGSNLTEETKDRFVRFRGLNTWGDDRFPWAEQGSEQAAEIIAWALLDDELAMASIRNSDPRTLAEAYELLTSTMPPPWARTSATVIGAVSPEGDPALPIPAGGPLRPSNWRCRVGAPAVKAAGIEWCTPHALRHSQAALAYSGRRVAVVGGETVRTYDCQGGLGHLWPAVRRYGMRPPPASRTRNRAPGAHQAKWWILASA